jgi:hypothetical protein
MHFFAELSKSIFVPQTPGKAYNLVLQLVSKVILDPEQKIK